uniref:Uncharacterized protein n=1 Tax=Graphocephala atropunctata TaxID=36148 RepID=A0A1B6KII9_9HEMI
MYFILLPLLFSCFVFSANAQSASARAGVGAADYWKLDDVLEFVSNGSVNGNSLSSLFTDLTQRATGEVDRLYHQLEGVLRQTPVATRLDPAALNANCTCYCRCPRDTASSRVIDDIKGKVMDLKKRFEYVGQSIKQKIYDMTTQ